MGEAQRYTRVARALHWLIALLVAGNVVGGIVIANVENQNTLYDLHRSTGFVILCLAAIRIVWRLTHRPPPLPAHMPALQKFAAEAVHWALYGFMFATPLAGWAAANAYGATVSVYWLFNLPSIAPKDEGLLNILKGTHAVLAISFTAAILVHFAGAMFHTIVQRDGLMRRMWPV